LKKEAKTFIHFSAYRRRLLWDCFARRCFLAVGLMVLLAAAAPLPHAKPAPRVAPADLAEQLAMLAFDANPAQDIPARDVLGRWAGPMRVLVFGRPSDNADAGAAARALGRAGVKMQVLRPAGAAAMAPNTFLVVDENLPGAFRGPLRTMLAQAFLDDEAAVDAFIAGVVETTPCWTLPVWTDARRVELKAAVIGVSARQDRVAVQHCILSGFGAALGLLGPGGFLPGSLFTPPSRAVRLSRDDERMIRVLYGPALAPGMTREQTQAAAARALAGPVGKRPPVHPHKRPARVPPAP